MAPQPERQKNQARKSIYDMRWTKKGLIFSTRGQFDWNRTHAQIPTVDTECGEGIWRIYYASRDVDGRSFTSYIDVEAGKPGNILYEHCEPILVPGNEASFDSKGVMPSWVVSKGKTKYLFYVGWGARSGLPYHNSVGLAISRDGKTFEKQSDGPLFDVTALEPHLTGTSCVLVEDGTWKNWYLSCTKWEEIDGRLEPFYHIKYAESRDGLNWERRGKVAIDFESDSEGGIARASVLVNDNGYAMWYCSRGACNYRVAGAGAYRIGYAESSDGLRWTRMDDRAGIGVSSKGWDSDMVAYPHVVKYEDKAFMFYNGNGFGASGFGYAVAECAPPPGRGH